MLFMRLFFVQYDAETSHSLSWSCCYDLHFDDVDANFVFSLVSSPEWLRFTFLLIFWVIWTFVFEWMIEQWQCWVESDSVGSHRTEFKWPLQCHTTDVYAALWQRFLTVVSSLDSIRDECRYSAKGWQEQCVQPVWTHGAWLTNLIFCPAHHKLLMKSIWVDHMYQGAACAYRRNKKGSREFVWNATGTLRKSFCNTVQALV